MKTPNNLQEYIAVICSVICGLAETVQYAVHHSYTLCEVNSCCVHSLWVAHSLWVLPHETNHSLSLVSLGCNMKMTLSSTCMICVSWQAVIRTSMLLAQACQSQLVAICSSICSPAGYVAN